MGRIEAAEVLRGWGSMWLGRLGSGEAQGSRSLPGSPEWDGEGLGHRYLPGPGQWGGRDRRSRSSGELGTGRARGGAGRQQVPAGPE